MSVKANPAYTARRAFLWKSAALTGLTDHVRRHRSLGSRLALGPSNMGRAW